MNRLQEIREKLRKYGITSELQIKGRRARLLIGRTDEQGYIIDTGFHYPNEIISTIGLSIKDTFGHDILD